MVYFIRLALVYGVGGFLVGEISSSNPFLPFFHLAFRDRKFIAFLSFESHI